MGTLKSFNSNNNYGFIVCAEVMAEYGNDTFVHGKELKGCNVGDTLVFEVGVSSKGQPQAMNVHKAAGGVTVDSMTTAVPIEPPAKKAKVAKMAEMGYSAPVEAAPEVAFVQPVPVGLQAGGVTNQAAYENANDAAFQDFNKFVATL